MPCLHCGYPVLSDPAYLCPNCDQAHAPLTGLSQRQGDFALALARDVEQARFEWRFTWEELAQVLYGLADQYAGNARFRPNNSRKREGEPSGP